jgi:hypothetical protein
MRTENPCHQAIFVNHTAGSVAPPNVERVQVGDASGQRAERLAALQPKHLLYLELDNGGEALPTVVQQGTRRVAQPRRQSPL